MATLRLSFVLRDICPISKNRRIVFSCSRFMSLKVENTQRQEPITPEFLKKPNQLKQLRVAVIGLPNAGKSTLINHLMQCTICPTSKKAHTTRANQKAALLDNDTQILFVDTPGVVNMKEKEKFQLPNDFVGAPVESIRDADLIAVIHSIENKILKNKLDPRVIPYLQRFPSKPSILVVNKIDKIRGKKSLLDTVYYLTGGFVNHQPILRRTQNKWQQNQQTEMEQMFKKMRETDAQDSTTTDPDLVQEVLAQDENGREVRGWPNFSEVFCISAKVGDGVDQIKEYLLKTAIPVNDWTFDKDVMTDCPPAILCERIVKAQLLEYLPNDIPYLLHPTLQFWDTGADGVLRIVVTVVAPNQRAYARIIGTRGKTLATMEQAAEQALQDLLKQPLKFHLHPELKTDRRTVSRRTSLMDRVSSL